MIPLPPTTKYQRMIDDVVKDRAFLTTPCQSVIDPIDIKLTVAVLRRAAQILDSNPKLRCLGLAANQLGFHWRIFVLKNARGKFDAYVNPLIIGKRGSKMSVETCYSQPGVTKTVERAMSVTLSSSNYPIRSFSGMEAIAVQHEIGHLNGVLI
jgi:peptide deformylase